MTPSSPAPAPLAGLQFEAAEKLAGQTSEKHA